MSFPKSFLTVKKSFDAFLVLNEWLYPFEMGFQLFIRFLLIGIAHNGREIFEPISLK